nr:hypothetical protein [Soonwooa sp.]
MQSKHVECYGKKVGNQENRYFIIKTVMLKGLGFSYVWKETLILAGMTAVLLTTALLKFKIRLE